MFFSVDLLSRRDSGLGLLWLAATLGSKSSFRKLPKRSILDANIAQLCNQISHPVEPLALRLSSNLMVGVARVFKVKHEIFVTEVNNCFILLKKAFQDIHALDGTGNAQLLMGQPTMRPDALTLAIDPTVAMALEFDNFGNWNDLAEMDGPEPGEGDGDYDPNARRGKKRVKSSLIPLEAGRALQHTLDEYHDHLLSTSCEGNNSLLGIDYSSSQVGVAAGMGSFIVNDDLFAGRDGGLDGLGDIGDDLARELGEGWGVDIGSIQGQQPGHPGDVHFGYADDMGMDAPFETFADNAGEARIGAHTPLPKSPTGRKRSYNDFDKENLPPSSMRHLQDSNQRSASNFFSPLVDMFMPMDNGAEAPSHPDHAQAEEAEHNASRPRRQKRVRILIDGRIELTDEELKAAREKYLEGQQAIRREQERKRMEKDSTKIIDNLIWGLPEGFEAPALADFWKSVFKVQVEARTGALHIENPENEGPARKRTKTNEHRTNAADRYDAETRAIITFAVGNDQAPMDLDFMDDMNFEGMVMDGRSQMRSSEEPERARRATSQPSRLPGEDLGINVDMLGIPSGGTQLSAFFPWDGAGVSSSAAGGPLIQAGGNASDRLSVQNIDVRLGDPPSSSSRGHRDSLLPTSLAGSLAGIDANVLDSPMVGGDDFQFNIDGKETQESAVNLITLERNSFNFLEYCKIQQNTQQAPLTLDDIVPVETSTRRIAATALYHCLVLSTKDLIAVKQNKPYDRIMILLKT